MALQFVDRAAVYTATTGAGAITIGSAVAGYQTPAAAGATVGNTLYYTIEDGAAWEIGLGTYTSSTVWTRSTVLHSTNSNAAISLDGNAVLTLSNPAEVAYLFAQLSGAAFTGPVSVAAVTTINDPGTASTASLVVNATASSNGAGIKLVGSGSNPSKTLRVSGGTFQVLNDAFTAALLSIADAGLVTVSYGLTVAGVATFSGGYVSGTGVNPYSSSLAWSGIGNGLTLTNTSTGSSATGTNLLSISGTSSSAHITFQYGSAGSYTAIGSISGTATSTTYSTTSDYRVKANVQPLDGPTALAAILSLVPSSYYFTSDPSQATHHGFLAHQVGAALPNNDAVVGVKDETVTATDAVYIGQLLVASGIAQADWQAGVLAGTYMPQSKWAASVTLPKLQGLDMAKITPDLVAAFKEHDRQIGQLRAQVQALMKLFNLNLAITSSSPPVPVATGAVSMQSRATGMGAAALPSGGGTTA